MAARFVLSLPIGYVHKAQGISAVRPQDEAQSNSASQDQFLSLNSEACSLETSYYIPSSCFSCSFLSLSFILGALFALMDPASAVIAFVGFGASITTLAGVLLHSAKLLVVIQQEIKDTPQEIEHCLRRIKILCGLLQAVEEADVRIQRHGSPTLRESWMETKDDMYTHLKNFDEKITQVHDALKATRSGLRVKATMKTFFNKAFLKEYQLKIAQDIGILTFFQSEFNSYVHLHA